MRYRRAIVTADVALPDSGAMVTLWRLRSGRKLNRISGLAYIKALLGTIDLGDVFWILPHERARTRLLDWMAQQSALPNPQSALRNPQFPLSPHLPRADLRQNCHRRKAPRLARRTPTAPRHHRHRRRRAGKARLVFAREFVFASGHSLHRWRARFRYRRSGCHSRLGGSVLSRLVPASSFATARLSSPALESASAAGAHREVWRWLAADEGGRTGACYQLIVVGQRTELRATPANQ